MNLLEYQAKELFRDVGIPVLPSQTIKDPRQIKQLQIPYPVVLKSQVRAGGRGKVGGIRFVANTIDAIAAARSIFNLSILGEYPEVILTEAHYNAEQEFFLAVVLDYQLKLPVLLGSSQGGMNVQSLLANLQQVVVDSEFSLFYARRLAVCMGLAGELIESVSNIIARMYTLFINKDLDLIEINPLGVNHQGQLMALDGKISLNASALSRHPNIESLKIFPGVDNPRAELSLDSSPPVSPVKIEWLNWQEKGKIAVICNSVDIALLTWDLICQNKVRPACGAIIGDTLESQFTDTDIYCEQLAKCLMELSTVRGLKVILINIWATETMNLAILETIVGYIESILGLNFKMSSSNSSSISRPAKVTPESKSKSTIKFVLRLINTQTEPINTESLFSNSESESFLYLTNSLEDSVEQTIIWAKSK